MNRLKPLLIALSLTASVFGAVAAQEPEFDFPGKFVFASNRDGLYQIYTMEGDGSNVEQITEGPEAHYYPLWSPDGEKILYIGDPDMTDDGPRILSLNVIDADGSNPVTIFQETETRQTTNFSDWSPDSERIAFGLLTYVTPDDLSPKFNLYVVNADGTDLTRIPFPSLSGVAAPRWTPDGELVAADEDGNLYIADADGSNVRPYVEDVGYAFNFMPDGDLLTTFDGAETYGGPGVSRADADGSDPQHIVDLPRFGLLFRVVPAPDGEHIMATMNTRPEPAPDGSQPETFPAVYVFDADGSNLENVTGDLYTVWSPDGRYLAYGATVNEHYQIMVLDILIGERTQLTTGDGDNSQPDWVGEPPHLEAGSASSEGRLDDVVYEPSIWG